MLPDDLLNPEAWGTPGPAGVELVQTHVSWVLRGEREVLKVKKPVSLGFLDFGTAELRRAACTAEVALNARLAPDVYLGVVPLVERPGGHVGLGGPGEGPAVDWAVRMRRMRDEDRADVRLARGALRGRDLDALARVVAAFHRRTDVDAGVAQQWGSRDAVRRNVVENFESTRRTIADYVPGEVAAEAERRQLAFLASHEGLFRRRVEGGSVRDGHGDLRLEHVYFAEEGIRILDCVEFDPRYRVADIASDAAFLAMDLEAHGRADLAEHWLAAFARASTDVDLYSVVDFYAGYRAWVRGKVALLLAEDAEVPEAVRERAGRDARRHFLLAVATSRPQLVRPTVVCVGGLIASGKSTVAEALVDELSCPIVDADRTRKAMIGVEELRRVHDPAWAGAYDLSFSERVYAEVLRRAAVVLDSGRSVIVDASFRSAAARRRARELAAAHRVPFRFVECRATVDACRTRLEARERTPGPSDGRLAIFDDFAARYEPVRELPPAEHVVLDTARPLEVSLDVLRRHVATWPRGLMA